MIKWSNGQMGKAQGYSLVSSCGIEMMTIADMGINVEVKKK